VIHDLLDLAMLVLGALATVDAGNVDDGFDRRIEQVVRRQGFRIALIVVLALNSFLLLTILSLQF
jgi:hypothetical protein